MNTSTITLRSIREADIPAAMRLSEAEGWNQTQDDWKLFTSHAQNVCMLATTGNKIIGTTTAINYANELAWLAMVLVEKTYRGKGISKLLLENVLEKLDSFKAIKLDATAAGQKVYTGFGFKEEYQVTRMVNTAVKNLPPEAGEQVFPVQPEDMPGIIALDKFVFGVDRSIMLHALFTQHSYKAWMTKRDGMITGFALGRNGSRYQHIGPVMAESAADAGALIGRALQDLVDKPVVADVLCDKTATINFLLSMGFEQQRTFVRMYKNDHIAFGNTGQYYLIVGPEFG